MFTLYVVLLIVGAGLALVSLAGDALGGGEIDLDALSGGGVEVDTHGGGGGSWWEAFSLLSLVYAAFGAGLVGTLLHLLWSGERTLLTGALAAGTGVACGALANATIVFLRRSGSGETAPESSFEGLMGEMILPFRTTPEVVPGQVRVRRGDRDHVLRALPWDGAPSPDHAPSESWTRVVVVEVRSGVAHVTPAGPEFDALTP
jgi:hypothetical protein